MAGFKRGPRRTLRDVFGLGLGVYMLYGKGDTSTDSNTGGRASLRTSETSSAAVTFYYVAIQVPKVTIPFVADQYWYLSLQLAPTVKARKRNICPSCAHTVCFLRKHRHSTYRGLVNSGRVGTGGISNKLYSLSPLRFRGNKPA
jgi:hypothetical protein